MPKKLFVAVKWKLVYNPKPADGTSLSQLLALVSFKSRQRSSRGQLTGSHGHQGGDEEEDEGRLGGHGDFSSISLGLQSAKTTGTAGPFIAHGLCAI